MPTKILDFSIIIPVFNSENSIETLVNSIENELINYKYEIILVNDGSKDNSSKICIKIAEEKSVVKFVDLRKNFGEFNAVMCGLSFVNGKYGIIIDDDFQNPPSEIIKLYQKAEEGDFDVVYSQYQTKKHNWIRNIGSRIVNTLATNLLKKPKDLYLSSFKSIKKEIIEEILNCKSPHPYIDGLIFQITNNIGTVLVKHNIRQNGQSNYSVKKLLSLFLTIIFGYSLLPLRLTFLAGFLSIIFSLAYMLLYAFSIIPEWGSPIVIFMCGVLLCAVSLVGEYVGNSFLMLSGKPQYVIKSVYHKATNNAE